MPCIHTIDLHYLGIPQAIAAYVVVGPDGPVLIETGPASTFSNLVNGLAKLGLKLSDIKHALVTHIHLDHAGAAGMLAAAGAHIYVHEFGAPHLVDPAKLLESATRIYGDQMDRLWGPMRPVPAHQITPLSDGDVIEACGLKITAIETPGHARHHHAFAIDNACFTGDVAGITIPGVPEPPVGRYIAVPTPPPEFDERAWLSSIAKLQAHHFAAIYPTHFGMRRNVAAHFERLMTVVSEHSSFVNRGLIANEPRDQILNGYIRWQRAEAAAAGISDAHFAKYTSTNLLTMNVDGIIRYWRKHASQPKTQQPAG